MLFNSVSFFIFLTIVLILYRLVKEKNKWIVLLGASYVFYMGWNPMFLLLILLSTFVDYWIGLKIFNTSIKKRKRSYLILSLSVNLGLLFYFKYFNFFLDSVYDLLEYSGFTYSKVNWDIVLPVGISFYTFQTLSYSIDIYKGKLAPINHLGKFALFVSFFPQLVAGPIERASNLIPQLNKLSWVKVSQIELALFQIIWGLFLKVVIADNTSIVVDVFFENYESLTGIRLVLPTFLFSFQIYAVFSGYSFMAIGIAKLFGIQFMDNFRTPYFSKSVTHFWSRWHISLSSWFKDYLYIPLGGNKVSIPRTYINLFIVFFISGIWHGAKWTFIFWGVFHGLVLIIERLFQSKKGNESTLYIIKIFKYSLTFSLVWFGWIFFRASTIAEAFHIISKIPKGLLMDLRDLFWLVKSWALGTNDVGFHFLSRWMELPLSANAIDNIEFLFVAIFLGIIMLLIMEFKGRKTGVEEVFRKLTYPKKVFLITAVILLIVFFGQYQSKNQFIYFQF